MSIKKYLLLIAFAIVASGSCFSISNRVPKTSISKKAVTSRKINQSVKKTGTILVQKNTADNDITVAQINESFNTILV